jgi:hypothetical protein
VAAWYSEPFLALKKRLEDKRITGENFSAAGMLLALGNGI